MNKKIDILKAFYTLKTSDVKYISGVEIYEVNNLKIEFLDKVKHWCTDGEEFESKSLVYQFDLKNDIEMLIPNKNIDKLFLK